MDLSHLPLITADNVLNPISSPLRTAEVDALTFRNMFHLSALVGRRRL